jgi:hypothetical protein
VGPDHRGTDSTQPQPHVVRRAAAAAAAALARLRAVMLSDMGMLATGPTPAGPAERDLFQHSFVPITSDAGAEPVTDPSIGHVAGTYT